MWNHVRQKALSDDRELFIIYWINLIKTTFALHFTCAENRIKNHPHPPRTIPPTVQQKQTYCGTVMMLAKPPLYALPIIIPISKMQPSTNISGTRWMLMRRVHVWRKCSATTESMHNANHTMMWRRRRRRQINFRVDRIAANQKSNKLKIIKKIHIFN